MSPLLILAVLVSAAPAKPDVPSQARALLAHKQLDEALALLKRAETTGTADTEVSLLHGQVCLLAGSCESAEMLADAKRALKEKPSFAALELEIETWFDSRELGFPLLEGDKALPRIRDPGERLWLLHQQFADNAILELWDDAAEIAAKELALAPSQSLARGDAALAALDLRKPEDALAQLKKLFAEDPDATEYHVIGMMADAQLGHRPRGGFYFRGADPMEPFDPATNGGNVAAAALMLSAEYEVPISAEVADAFLCANAGFLGNQVRWDVVGELGRILGLPPLVGRQAHLEGNLAEMLAAGRRVAAEVTYSEGGKSHLQWLVVLRAIDRDNFDVRDPATGDDLRLAWQARDRFSGQWKVVAKPEGPAPAHEYQPTRVLATLRHPGDKPFKNEDP